MTSTNPKDIAARNRSPMCLVPPVINVAMAKAMEDGANKYGPYNWRSRDVGAMTYISAMLRHISAWQDGQDLDPGSGAPHLAHVAAGCAIVLDALACGTLLDDRPVPGKAGDYIKAIANGQNPFHDSREEVEDQEVPPVGPPAWDGGRV